MRHNKVRQMIAVGLGKSSKIIKHIRVACLFQANIRSFIAARSYSKSQHASWREYSEDHDTINFPICKTSSLRFFPSTRKYGVLQYRPGEHVREYLQYLGIIIGKPWVLREAGSLSTDSHLYDWKL